jgi:hypothetical protein
VNITHCVLLFSSLKSGQRVMGRRCYSCTVVGFSIRRCQANRFLFPTGGRVFVTVKHSVGRGNIHWLLALHSSGRCDAILCNFVPHWV